MATYLKFHQLERSPFEGAGSERLVLATESLRRAYAEVKSGLGEDSPRVCIGGGPGIGKSSLARALPKLLAQEAHTALIRDASLDWSRLKGVIAKQLDLEEGQLSRASLGAVRADGRRVVIIIDDAEQLTSESLEHLDIVLGYRDDSGEQLVQCVLLASLEDAPRGKDVPLLWWMDKLTTRQLTLAPIPEAGVRSYVDKHLKKAGGEGAAIFADEAIIAIHRYTGGVPGAVSACCEQLLTKTASLNKHEITANLVARMFGDAAEVEESEPEPEALELGTPDELPHFDVRPTSPGATGRPSPPAPARPAEPELELDIQQGLLPVDGSNYGDESDFFKDVPRMNETRSEPRSTPRFSGPSPGDGRGARMIRNLIGLAVVAVLAAVAHGVWMNDPPHIRVEMPAMPAMPSMPEIPSIPKLTASDAAPEPTSNEPELALTEPQGEPALALGTNGPAETFQAEPGAASETGLTSDLVLGDAVNNQAALEASNKALVEKTAPAGQEPSQLSLNELYEIAEKTKTETPAESEVEPWSQQGPEDGESVPAAPEPSAPAPAAPRPTAPKAPQQ
jgi:type II secretory pathway predicted ATPase ExeA